MALREKLNAPGLVLGAFSFALAVAYVPGILGSADSGRWWLLSLCVPAAVAIRNVEWTLGHALGATLIAWAAVSMLWTASLYDGAAELWQWMLYAGIACVAATLPSLRPVYIGLGLGFAANSALVIAQAYFAFHGIAQVVAPAGLYMNKNYVAEPAALVLVALVGSRLWWLAAAVVPAVVLPDARGALLGLAAAFLTWLWRYSRLAVLAAACAVFAACFVGLHGASVSERLQIWHDTVAAFTPLGHGIGSFFTLFPKAAPSFDLLVSRPGHAHSDLLELAFELGIPGALLAVALCVHLMNVVAVERAILAAFITECLFGFPLHNPVTGFVFAVAAGGLLGAWHRVHGDVGLRGVGIRARAVEREWRGSGGPLGAGQGSIPV